MLRQFHGLDPGLEFKVGLEEADRVEARLVLGDRDQDATVRALREALTWRHPPSHRAVRIAAETDTPGWIRSSRAFGVRGLVRSRARRRSCSRQGERRRRWRRRCARSFPRVAAAMLDQRDDIMTPNLLRECLGRTVAVVGMAHMDGIEERWRAAQGGDGGVSLISGP